jgi:hypothetical protein
MSPKILNEGKSIRDKTVENKKPAKRLIPPNEGFDRLLQRIIMSLLLRIPRDWEKRNNNTLLTTDISTDPEKKRK